MILAAKDQPITLSKLSEHVDAHYNTVWRWWRYGVVNRETGQIIKLKTVRHTSGRRTTLEMYEQFLSELSDGDGFHGTSKQMAKRRAQ